LSKAFSVPPFVRDELRMHLPLGKLATSVPTEPWPTAKYCMKETFTAINAFPD
jgi:hypothetical protein